MLRDVALTPDDVLTLDEGKLFVNGLQVDESYLDPDCGPMSSLAAAGVEATTTRGPIPMGDVFVMGDNRCDSLDSRTFGPVPESQLIGRAFAVIWPLSRLHTL